jgi:hypothetical protein
VVIRVAGVRSLADEITIAGLTAIRGRDGDRGRNLVRKGSLQTGQVWVSVDGLEEIAAMIADVAGLGYQMMRHLFLNAE